MKFKKLFKTISLLFLLILFSGCLPNQPPDGEAELAEDFSLPTFDEACFTLSKHFGQPILLYFFRIDCSSCQKETPNLVDMYNTYKNAGLLVVGIVTRATSTQELRTFIESYGITYPILIDENREVCNMYGVYYIPHNFFINREGKVVEDKVGPMSKTELEEAIMNIL